MDLEIWQCDHMEEVYLSWISSRQEDWRDTHSYEYDDEEVCKPEIHTIPVEDIKEEFLEG